MFPSFERFDIDGLRRWIRINSYGVHNKTSSADPGLRKSTNDEIPAPERFIVEGCNDAIVQVPKNAIRVIQLLIFNLLTES